jgi:hypothetical protein
MVIGYMIDNLRFRIVRLERFAAQEEPDVILNEIAKRCREFSVAAIAADGGGNGRTYNRLLLRRLQPRPHLYGILYSVADHQPIQDGAIWSWTVNRSASIGTTFARIQAKLLEFPRVTECGSFLDEFTCELAVYDDKSRTVKYTHPDTQQDDALHATNYAQLLGLRNANAQAQYAG